MTWKIHNKEIKDVLALPARERYGHFLKKVADWEIVWSLANEDGWMLAGDDIGAEIVPVWPHERYAQLCAVDRWQDASPRAISLDDWLAKWLPGIALDNRQIAICPTPVGKGAIVAPDRLKRDLEQELADYERRRLERRAV